MLARLKAPLRRFALYRALRFGWHCVIDRTFRGDQRMRLRPPANLFQYRSLTLPDRYPRIFAFVADRLSEAPASRVLSFGCATGDEVFSLRRYLPHAAIKGVDINPGNIALCRRRLAASGDPGIVFQQQDSAADEAPGSYDAIFCMAVFQHSSLQDPTLLSCERYLRFEAFEATLAGLARALKPGGYLAIRHADFRFTDTACSQGFHPVLRIEASGPPHPRFGRDHRRLPAETDSDVVFQKR